MAVATPAAAQVVVKGRLVDGTAMLRARSDVDADGFSAEATRVPIVEERFRLTLIPSLTDGARSGKSWTGKTDADGRFEVQLGGMAALPAGARFVASATESRTRSAHYSMPVDVAAGAETEFRLYKATASSGYLQNSQLGMFLSLVDGDGPKSAGKLLSVRSVLTISNASGEIFVGRKLNPNSLSSTRACFRLPLAGTRETGLKVVKNEAAGPDSPFTITRDGWAILDSPVAPYPEAPFGSRWEFEYTVPATQEMILSIPVDIPLKQLAVFGALGGPKGKDLDLATLPETLEKAADQAMPDPATGDPTRWVILHGRDIEADKAFPIRVTIDNLPLRQVNRRALKVVLTLVIGCIIAVLVGLILGQRGPKVESVLSEASGEEIIERIAQLDAQFKKQLVSEDEYRATRERLLSLARYEVSELAGGTSGADRGAGKASAGGAAARLPDDIARLVARLDALESVTGDDSAGDPTADSTRANERLELLEELAKAVRDQAGERVSAGDGS